MRRFTRELSALVIIIVLIGLAVLFGPFVRGFLAERAHDADRSLLQEAIPIYQEARVFPQPEWPTLSGETGVPREGNAAGYQCDGSDGGETCSWLALELLAEHGGLESTATITSAETTLNVGATNAPSGNYGWYLDTAGQVGSEPAFDRDVGYP
ncbi:MAG: hypothetical protein OXC55_05630 [Chloroflexi bacterium]|nr:hypothetical protein [Chloroflexota bacterium]